MNQHLTHLTVLTVIAVSHIFVTEKVSFATLSTSFAPNCTLPTVTAVYCSSCVLSVVCIRHHEKSETLKAKVVFIYSIFKIPESLFNPGSVEILYVK